MDAWWTATAGPMFGALGALGAAVVAAWATRDKARKEGKRAREQEAEDRLVRLRQELDGHRVQHDAMLDYIYELRGGYHAMGLEPPQWPRMAAPPWVALADKADSQ